MDIKLERTCWAPAGRIKTHISSHCPHPVDVGVLQEKLASSVTELSTHLAQVSEKLKQNAGEAKAAAGLASDPHDCSEPADKLQRT